MAAPTLRELLHVAIDAAHLAGRRTLAYFQTGVQPETKSDNTPVTVADREAESVLRDRIARDFPDHGILGEEQGDTPGDPDYQWIVDPIDGTKAFVAGVPLYAVLVGVVVRGVPSVGVIYHPALDEMVTAATGLGCHWNGRPCRVSEVSRLDQAVLVTSSIVRCRERSDAFDRLTAATRLQRTWGDAYGYTLVATGRAEVMLDPALSIWDCSPMPVILREAGGSFSDWNGREVIDRGEGVAVNRNIAHATLEILGSEIRSPAST